MELFIIEQNSTYDKSLWGESNVGFFTEIPGKVGKLPFSSQCLPVGLFQSFHELSRPIFPGAPDLSTMMCWNITNSTCLNRTCLSPPIFALLMDKTEVKNKNITSHPIAPPPYPSYNLPCAPPTTSKVTLLFFVSLP